MLRGLACLAVLFLHIPHRSPSWGTAPSVEYYVLLPVEWGYYGVTLFIVLSGFCIHLSVLKGMQTTHQARPQWGLFWKRRFWRLYPPYVAAILLSLSVMVLLAWQGGKESPYHLGTVSFWGDLLTHLLMVHNLFRDYGLGLGNGSLWSLGMEEQLYALYALYLLLRQRCGLKVALGVTLLVKCLWGSTTFGVPFFYTPLNNHAGPFGGWQLWPLGYWFAWVLGSVAAEAYLGQVQLPKWCYSGRLLGAVLLLAVVTHPQLWLPLTGCANLDDLIYRPEVSNLWRRLVRWRVHVGVDALPGLACFLWVNR
jgi:peptidoglycan/LPS O-acetylase OafA/YrhL